MAFSCNRRGICPSCGTRRMDEAAAHLVDHVIPKVPVRQWVLSFPIPLRSSAANLNIHLHAWCSKPSVTDTIDTAHECPPVPAAPIFHPAGAPTHAALQSLLGKIITRILRLLTRLGHLVEEEGETYLAGGVTDPDDVMTPLQAAAANYRIAQGPRAGQKVLSLQLAPRRPARGGESSALCANAHGFSLHADVRCEAEDRQGLEQLCRYITSHHVMTPMQFMQRLATLVPRPRLHLIRFHGVLAPHAKQRRAVVPLPTATAPAHAGDCAQTPAGSAKGRMRWAQLLKRVFDTDIEQCPYCGGQLKLIAAIEEPAVIQRILTHLGLAAQPPPRAPAVRVDLFQAA